MAEPYNIKDKKPKKKGAHGLINAMIEKTEKFGKYVLDPFIGRSDSQKYLGGKEGFDIADPFDIAHSTLASGYRVFDQLVRRPLVTGGMKIGDKIASMSGESIQSQEEAEIFLNRYDPEGSNKKEGYDITYNEPVEGQSRNYFRPRGEGWAKYFAMASGKEGINLQPHEGAKGVEPITAAEEVEHGRRWSTGNTALVTGEGDFKDWSSRFVEETATKGTALKNVFQKEGALEGIASMPSLLSTWLSYALPSSSHYNMGGYEDNVLNLTQQGGKKLYEGLKKAGYGNEDKLDLAVVKHPDYKTFMKTDPDTGEEYEGSNYTEVLQTMIPELAGMDTREVFAQLGNVNRYEERQTEKNPFSILTNWWQRGNVGATDKQNRGYKRRAKKRAKAKARATKKKK